MGEGHRNYNLMDDINMLSVTQYFMGIAMNRSSSCAETCHMSLSLSLTVIHFIH